MVLKVDTHLPEDLLCDFSYSISSLILRVSLQVEPKHVKEAFRLLNKSIIRVETPDIQFDEQENEGNMLLNPNLYQKVSYGLMFILLRTEAFQYGGM